MLFVKLGLLAFMGKKFYSGFLLANLVTHSTHTLKLKLREVAK